MDKIDLTELMGPYKRGLVKEYLSKNAPCLKDRRLGECLVRGWEFIEASPDSPALVELIEALDDPDKRLIIPSLTRRVLYTWDYQTLVVYKALRYWSLNGGNVSRVGKALKRLMNRVRGVCDCELEAIKCLGVIYSYAGFELGEGE